MVNFLQHKVEMAFRRFVCTDLAYKYDMYIEVRDDNIVTGYCGEDVIEECLNVGFFPSDAKTEHIELKIADDIHRYCYEHNLKLDMKLNIERSVWNGEIRYGLLYTERK